MAKCDYCGKRFNLSEAKEMFNEEFGDVHYDDIYFNDEIICGDCAIEQASSNMAVGRAILMVNGEEDYDDDFVQRWL